MSADETQEQIEADDDGTEAPADPPLTDDEIEAAEEAERELDPDPNAEPEPGPEHEARGAHEVDWEKRNREAEKRFATYQRALEKIYEDDFGQLANCPLCLGPTPGFVVIGAAGRIPDEQADLVKHFLGLARPVDLQPDPETSTCSTCGGEGKTLTGSKVPTQRERTCPTCKGYGYTPPPNARQNGAVEVVPGEPVGGSATPDIAQEERDEWGEPLTLPDGRENPNYGRMPHRKVMVAPWGTTAGLSAQDAVVAGGS